MSKSFAEQAPFYRKLGCAHRPDRTFEHVLVAVNPTNHDGQREDRWMPDEKN